MKIQIDTKEKTIKVEEDVVISSLLEALGKLFPKGEYKKYTLITNTTITNWNYPICIDRYPAKPYEPYWWARPTCECANNDVQNFEILC